MGKPDNTGILRVIRAARYSAQGFVHAFRHESAFRQELALGVIMFPAAFWLGRSPLEIALLVAVCILVLIVELLNSAVEAAIDRHGDEMHELSGRAKDMGSAAVSLSLILVWVIWGAVIYDRFFRLGQPPI